jgi:transposase-like protein
MTVARMAEQYGVSADTVYKVLRAHGIRGTHSTAKLSSAKVRAIRQKYAKTRNASALAREYGVNPSTIRGIVRGDYWKWVK